MRVALACPYDWEAPGGVQVHVRELSEQLRRRGHDVLVLAPGNRATAADEVEVVGRPVRVPYQGTVAPICPSPASFARVRRSLRSFRPDVVHAHEPLVPSTSLFAALAAPVPVVGTFHAHVERSGLFDATARLVRPVWRRLAVRIAVSEAARWFVRSRLGGEVRIIPNGLDVERFSSAEPAEGLPDGRRVLWVGRLDRQKGFSVACAAFEELARRRSDVWFVVAGDGRDRRALDGMRADARERVVMLGAVPHRELARLHAACEVFVAPAVGQESFGMVLLEAMAAGTPVVATDIPGYREVVRRGIDGLLVRPGDAGALAAVLARVLEDPALARSLAGGARDRARRYAWDNVVEEIEAAYREAARGR